MGRYLTNYTEKAIVLNFITVCGLTTSPSPLRIVERAPDPLQTVRKPFQWFRRSTRTSILERMGNGETNRKGDQGRHRQ